MSKLSRRETLAGGGKAVAAAAVALPDFIPGTKFRSKIAGEITCPRKVRDTWPDA